MSSVAELNVTVGKLTATPEKIQNINSKSPVKTQAVKSSSVFTPEAELDNNAYRYMVRLTESPVALYQGSIAGFKATSPEQTAGNSRKLDVKANHVKAYRSFLTKRQDSVIAQANKVIGNLDVKQRTTLAYNGLVIEMTQAQAMELAKVPGVAHIKREKLRYVQTDTGPGYIKADAIWDGSANGTSAMGEGMIVGIIDTGINTDHPSFADIGGDGYDHTNPDGAGVYSGDCATAEFASLCNDKLIGVHSYPVITDRYAEFNEEVPSNGEDHDGHGSHTAGTTAGNILLNQDVTNVEGGATGVVFEKMSGVAPHANIISYQVCLPGDRGTNFSGCFPSLTVLAVEHAIEAGVDAINYSIGGGTSDPWNDADALSYLAARKAGIHVATSAGNDGPGPGTVGSPGDAPWITTVAAYTHNRDLGSKSVDFAGGDSELASFEGQAITGGFEGKVVYAGDFTNSNDPGGDPAQCLQPFPAETFAADTIVLCDRGAIARVDKGRHVRDGGAAGLILANLQGGASSVVADAHVIPSIHVDADDGDMIRSWLDTGTGHMATIGTSTLSYASETEDTGETQVGRIAADFTSRGPNVSVPDVIVPSIAAPGVSIYAAYADDQPVGFTAAPAPNDFAFLSGTSMASPHVAGALTLLASIHPDWSPAEAQSALMMTANQDTKKDDAVTASDFFDMGAGFADLNAAAKAGLVMDESFANYMKANPGVGGVPSQMNLASMANSKCVDTCSWTRTVKATADGSWTASSVSITEELAVTVTPATFELAAGETQELTITADATAAELASGWSFANVVLTAEGMPTAKLPVAVKVSGNNLPGSLALTANRSEGSMTYTGFKSKDLTDIEVGVFDKRSLLLPAIDLAVPDQGLDYAFLTFSETVPNVVFSISSETAPDVDLRILDSTFANIGSSAGPDSNESVGFVNLPAGSYYIVVDGYAASASGATDAVSLEVSSILTDTASASEYLSAAVVEGEDDFSVTVSWSDDAPTSAILQLTSGDGSASQQIPLSFTRGEDDVAEMVPSDLVDGNQAMTPGVAQAVSFDLAPNFTNEDKVYTLTAEVSAGQEIANVNNDGVVSGNMVTWTITREVGASAEVLPVGFDLIPRQASTGNELTLTNTLGDDTVTSSYSFGVVEVAPVAAITGLSSATEGSTVNADASTSSDANADSLTYAWVQLSGTPVSFDASAASISFTAPNVTTDETISFQLTVDDGNGNTDTTTASASIVNKKESGSFGWLMLLLTPMLFTRRKKA